MKWYIKQIFPCWYHTKYEEDGRKYVTWWKMWLGRCYKREVFEVAA